MPRDISQIERADIDLLQDSRRRFLPFLKTVNPNDISESQRLMLTELCYRLSVEVTPENEREVLEHLKSLCR